MYNLIIADDEYIIRESLASFVDWNKLGFKIVLVAKDGEEVIELLEIRQDIDVILSDIEMKDISGLEVAKYVFDNRLDAQIVIISGYREFEYARKAMSYNVSHYLLKPIDIGSITEAFVKVKAELDQTNANKRKQQQQKSEIEHFKRAVCENFFELAYLGLFSKENDISFYLKKFDLFDYLNSLHFYEFSLKLESVTDYDIFTKEIIYNIFSMLTAKHELSHLPIILSKSEISYSIIHPCENDGCGSGVTAFYDEIQKAMWDICHIKAVVELKIENLNLCEFVTELNSTSLKSYSEEGEYLDSMARQYLLILNMTSEIEETSKILSGIFNRMLLGLNDERKKEQTDKLFDEIERLIEFQLPQNSTCRQILKELTDTITPENYFEEKLKVIYNLLKKDDLYSASTTDSVKNIISRRITQNISLQQAADEVFISPNYLSRLFKEQTGENFSDYTIKIKMEKAAELLKKSNMKVYEISEYLGYKSLQYFYKLFKRIYFCTPSEYREQF